jgi:hypothetical protein
MKMKKIDKGKERTQRKHKNVHIYVANTDKAVICCKTDPSSRQGGRPTTNKTATVLTRTSIWSESQRGSMQRRTDWPTVSCKVTLTLSLTHHFAFPQTLRSISLLSTTGKLSEKVVQKNSPKASWKKQLAKCKLVWLSCTSQHDTSMNDAYASRDH